VALGSGCTPDQLNELTLGPASVEATDQMKDGRMLHPRGFGRAGQPVEPFEPGPNGITRPGSRNPPAGLQRHSEIGASMPFGRVGSMRTAGPIVDESVRDWM
jgi:hypothetical protein